MAKKQKDDELDFDIEQYRVYDETGDELDFDIEQYRVYDEPGGGEGFDIEQYEDREIDPLVAAFRGARAGLANPVLGMLQALGPEAIQPWVQRRHQDINRQYQEASAESPYITGAGKLLGDVAPFAAMTNPAASAVRGVGAALGRAAPLANFAKANPVLTRGLAAAGEGGIAGGAVGAAEYVNEEDDRLTNAMLGAGLGAIGQPAGEFALGAAKKGVKGLARQFGGEKAVGEDLLKGLLPEERAMTREAQEAGRALGLVLTPAEASGNPLLAQAESRLGKTPETKEAYYGMKRAQQGEQRRAIDSLMENISPSDLPSDIEARKAAENVIEKQKGYRSEVSAPYFEAAKNEQLPTDIFKDLTENSTIESQIKKIRKDKAYAPALKETPTNSVGFLQLVKESLDDEVNAAYKAGKSKRAKMLGETRDILRDSLKKHSPDYATALDVYAKESIPVDKLLDSPIGTVARMSDEQLKNVSSRIFDRSQTNPEVLKKLRDKYSEQDPELWSRMVRNAMENKLDTSAVAQTEKYGNNFYSKLLREEKDYNQWRTALEGNPDAQEKLGQMRKAFKNLLGAETAKGAAGRNLSGVDQSRNTFTASGIMLKNLTGGAYDRAAMDILKTGKWDAQFNKIMDMPKDSQSQTFLKLLNKISQPFQAPQREAIVSATEADFMPEDFQQYLQRQ